MNNSGSQPASINDFERAVLARNYETAEDLIIKLVSLYGKDRTDLTLAPFDRKLSLEQSDLESYQVIEKLAFTLTLWWSDLSWLPSAKTFTFFVMNKSFINSVFAASSYHSTDHILANLGLLGKANYSIDEIKRMLLVVTLESDIDIPWGALLQHIPDEAAQTLIGLISAMGLQLSQRAQNNIDKLLDMVELLPPINTNRIDNLGPLIKTFFNCSSLTNSKKYNVKKWIVKAIELYVKNHVEPQFKKQLKTQVKSRPFLKNQTVLFIHEHYGSNHAMYRSWHAAFASLKDKFNTVALSHEKSIDSVSARDFDQVITLKPSAKVEDFVTQVLKIKPDVIIYPSIGMSMFAPFTAAMRLAPIQIALPGHPSSSYLSTIDYFIVSREGLSDQDMDNILTETWVECIDGPGEVVILDKERKVKKSDTDEFHVAVNGVIQKVSHQLLQSCVRISQQSQKEIKFVFFMAHPKQDIEYFAAKSILRRFLPNSILYPFSDYTTYLERMSKCKFAIPTIPFGGSNSNIDLVELGIPKLFTKHHSDLSGTTDAQMWQALGVVDGFCSSVEELENRAIELINQPNKLIELTNKIELIDIEQLGLSKAKEPAQTRFFKTLSSLIDDRANR